MWCLSVSSYLVVVCGLQEIPLVCMKGLVSVALFRTCAGSAVCTIVSFTISRIVWTCCGRNIALMFRGGLIDSCKTSSEKSGRV